MGDLCGHFVYILVCVSIVCCQVEKGISINHGARNNTIMAPLSGVRASANKDFQRLQYIQPFEGKKQSPIVFRRTKGKEVNIGLTLSTVFNIDRFVHIVTATDKRLIDSFRKADIPEGNVQIIELYDLDIGSLDHEDMLQYIDQHHHRLDNREVLPNGNELQLTLLYYEHPFSVTVKVLIASDGFHLLDKEVDAVAYRHVVMTVKLNDGRMYRDNRCVIASAVDINSYITAFTNGHLGLKPLLLNGGGPSERRAVFIMRQYLGFTSKVHNPYRVFRDGSSVHVHMFQVLEEEDAAPNKDGNGTTSSRVFSQEGAAVGYISRGFQGGAGTNNMSRSGFQGEEEAVFINRRSRTINNHVLREDDPRFFYEMKISGTDLSVFMSTSKPDHYLAVSGDKATLSLKQVPNAKDFLQGYDEAKFKVFEIGKQLNLTSHFLGKL